MFLEGEVALDTEADSARFAARPARPDLGVNASVEISRCRSNSVAKPEVARIRIESRVPGHQKMKRLQFSGRFHEAQFSIALNH